MMPSVAAGPSGLAAVGRLIFVMESLILAQNERWRHGLGMQVEREAPACWSGKWRKGE